MPVRWGLNISALLALRSRLDIAKSGYDGGNHPGHGGIGFSLQVMIASAVLGGGVMQCPGFLKQSGRLRAGNQLS
jgi:hypothetical protein